MEKALILVVEQNRPVIEDTVKALANAGYEVVEAFNAADGIRKIHELNPDLVIASTDLPPVDGENACLRIRQASYLPVVVFGDKEEVVVALEQGADAYIVKPASGREVVARVNSVLRRKKNDDNSEGGGTVGIKQLLHDGENNPDSFSDVEYRLSTCLLCNNGKLLDYPQIITEVWGNKRVKVDTLHFYIRRLRRKLANFRIFGIRGVGYGLSLGGQATP